MFEKSLDSKGTYFVGDNIEVIDLADSIFDRKKSIDQVYTIYKVSKEYEMRPDLISKVLYGTTDYTEMILKYSMLNNPFAIERGDLILAVTMSYIHHPLKDIEYDRTSVFDAVMNYHKYIDKNKVPDSPGSDKVTNKTSYNPYGVDNSSAGGNGTGTNGNGGNNNGNGGNNNGNGGNGTGTNGNGFGPSDNINGSGVNGSGSGIGGSGIEGTGYDNNGYNNNTPNGVNGSTNGLTGSGNSGNGGNNNINTVNGTPTGSGINAGTRTTSNGPIEANITKTGNNGITIKDGKIYFGAVEDSISATQSDIVDCAVNGTTLGEFLNATLRNA